MLELDHVRCVLDIAETRSFSRSADRLGLAQSVISKRVRRVEDQIGLRIFARTSRSVDLTDNGRAFLPYARSMIDAEAAARHAAKCLTDEMADQLILGTYDYLINYRLEMMDAFHRDHPQSRTEVQFGTRSELFAGLRSGRIDVAVLANIPSFFEPDFTSVKFPDLHAHMLVEPDHPLFANQHIVPADLAGLSIVYSPSQQDPLVRGEISNRLIRCGATLIPAPEAHRPAMEHYARIRHIPVLRWMSGQHERHIDADQAVIPIAGLPMSIEVVVYAAKLIQRPSTIRFLQSVTKLRDKVVESNINIADFN